MDYMALAVELAYGGMGHTKTNPMVGAVIIKDNQIVSRGYHAIYGGAHAEAMAIRRSKEAGVSLKGSTMYVTLEPCNHQGKTPPCTEAIMEAGIEKVVIGRIDPYPLVAGQGIERLKANGIIVEVLEYRQDIEELYEAYDKQVKLGSPFVVAKFAMSLDGKIATYTGHSKWITSEKSRNYGHKLRQRYDAILVGSQTVKADDTMLTVRHPDYPEDLASHPVRIILDSTGSIDVDCKLIQTASLYSTILATTDLISKEKVKILEKLNVRVIKVRKNDEGRVTMKELFSHLPHLGIHSVLIEGGGQVLFSAVREGVVDKIIGFIAPKIIGGSNAPTPFSGIGFDRVDKGKEVKNLTVTHIGKDMMIKGYLESNNTGI